MGCLGAYGAPVDPNTVLGGFQGVNYSQASAFVVNFPVTNFVNDSSEQVAAAVAWEEAFIRLAKVTDTTSPRRAQGGGTFEYVQGGGECDAINNSNENSEIRWLVFLGFLGPFRFVSACCNSFL